VKRAYLKFGNDQIFDMANSDETDKWTRLSENEFSHRLVPILTNHPAAGPLRFLDPSATNLVRRFSQKGNE